MIELIKANAKFFFITWGIVLLINQIFIFGGCLAPYCIVAALPHTGVISAMKRKSVKSLSLKVILSSTMDLSEELQMEG